MKYVNFVIRTIIGMLASFLLFYLNLMMGINMLTWALWFILPMGGMLFGMIIGFLAKGGILKDNKPFNTVHIVGLIIAGVVLVGLMTYADYATCYITGSGKTSRTFSGSHISNYEVDGQPVDFSKYFDMSYVNAEMTLSIKGNRSHPISLGSSGYVGFVYFMQYVGIIGFSLLFASLVRRMPTCKKCGKYYIKKEIDRFVTQQSANDIAVSFFTKLNQSDNYQKEEGNACGMFYTLVAYYCPDCQDGFMCVVHHVKQGKSSREVIEASYKLNAEHLVKLGLVKNR